MSSPHTPVVIGVGDFVNRSKKVNDAIEPLDLILSAFHNALEDTGLSESARQDLTRSIDSVNAVRTWTWQYSDLPSLIAERLSISPRHKWYSEHGGNSPGLLFDEAARRVSKGDSKVALVAGAEALASLSACAAEGQLPPPGWTKTDQEINSVFSPTTRELKPDLGAVHSIGNPIHIYPLYENAFRAHRGQSIVDNNTESAKLYASFAKVAEHNQYAWSYGAPAQTEESIGNVSKKNRMICSPYPLLMNAFNAVNMAAVSIVTSTEFARQLGVSESKWIYPLGGAGTKDSDDFWERPDFYSSPSISRSIDAALQASNINKADIDLYDFYSCFPIVPKLACHHLNLSILDPPNPHTILGGLTSFGGAGNNYSLHAITEMVRQLRANKGENGLILANGGVVTYQHVVCLSRRPRKDGSAYPDHNPLPEKITDVPVPQVVEQASGDAEIETYTVEYQRDGKPLRAYIVGRLVNGKRFVANHADSPTLEALCSEKDEPIGRKGKVSVNEGGRNVLKLSHIDGAKL